MNSHPCWMSCQDMLWDALRDDAHTLWADWWGLVATWRPCSVQLWAGAPAQVD